SAPLTFARSTSGRFAGNACHPLRWACHHHLISMSTDASQSSSRHTQPSGAKGKFARCRRLREFLWQQKHKLAPSKWLRILTARYFVPGSFLRPAGLCPVPLPMLRIGAVSGLSVQAFY
ncbi:MAG: hypothetical protein ACHQIM_14605, partial [Sphingobacteriales bacterium]